MGSCGPIIFCNVLGQLTLQTQDRETHADISDAVRDLSFFSFHDRISLPGRAHPSPLSTRNESLDAIELAQLVAPTLQTWAASVRALDHRSARLFSKLVGPRHYACWQVTPNACHVIEAFSHAPMTSAPKAS
jgi:hypothetical protein